MSFASFIARRYLKTKDKAFGFSLLGTLGLLGVILGVFALIVVQGVMAGFSRDLHEKLLGFSAPILLTPLESKDFNGKTPPVLGKYQANPVYPFLETELILVPPSEQAQGVKLKGVTEKDPLFQKIEIEFVEGMGPADLSSQEDQLPGILVGSELSEKMGLIPLLTEEISLVFPFGEIDPSGEMRPKQRRFRVIGTFKSKYYEYDHKYVLLDLNEARRLLPSSEVPTQWALQIPQVLNSDLVAQDLEKNLKSSYQIRSFASMHQKIFAALKLERFVMFLVLGLMILIASFSIFSLTFLLVVQKKREIALFKAIGFKNKEIERIFARIGWILGFWGTLIGLLLAIGTIFYLQTHPLPMPSSYYLTHLPIAWDPISIFLIILLAPCLTFLAAWIPSRLVNRVHPVEALRSE